MEVHRVMLSVTFQIYFVVFSAILSRWSGTSYVLRVSVVNNMYIKIFI